MHKSNVAARVIYATPALHPTHWLIYAQAEIEKLNGARLTLESQIIALEGTVTNADTVAAMKSGASACAASESRRLARGISTLICSLWPTKGGNGDSFGRTDAL